MGLSAASLWDPSGFQDKVYLEWGWVKDDDKKEDSGSPASVLSAPSAVPCQVISVMSDSATLWMVACQSPLSMGFSRHKYWSGLSFPPPGDLPDPGFEPESLKSPEVGAKYPLERAGRRVRSPGLSFTPTGLQHLHTHGLSSRTVHSFIQHTNFWWDWGTHGSEGHVTAVVRPPGPSKRKGRK